MHSTRQKSSALPAQRRSLSLEKLEDRLLLSGATMYVDDAFTSGTPGWGVDHFAKIQDGINAAGAGDTVMVAAGTYNENITVNSAHDGLTLQGAGAAVTIIDGGGSDTVVNLKSFDGGIISGFTIRNGSATEGGGISCDSSDSTITSCIITGNAAELDGGGVYVTSGSPTIVDDVLTNNTALFGAAFYVDSASPIIANNTVYGNTAGSCGGGLYGTDSVFTMANCILWNNASNELFPNHEIMLRSDAHLTISYSIIMDGKSEIYAWMGADFTYDSTDSKSNPLFVAPDSGDFHLQAASPAIDAADGDLAPATDFAGAPRVDDLLIANRGVGTPAYADIGAFEYGSVVNNSPPTVSSLQVSADPVTPPDNLTLTALGVSDPDGDGTVAAVQFYRDANGNGTLDPGTDVLLGTDTNGADGWSWTGSTAGWPVGTQTYLARAQDNAGAWSNVVSNTGDVLNPRPSVASLGTSMSGHSLTLTAVGAVDPDGTIQAAEFYMDANSDGVLEPGTDTLLGGGTPSGGNWVSGAVDTTGWTPGSYTFFTRVQGSDSVWSTPVAAQVAVGYRSVGVITGAGGTEVRVYDCDNTADVTLSNISVKFGKSGAISSVTLNGTQAMSGLGLAIDGATSIGSIVDARKGALGAIAFIAADAPIKSVQLKGGMTGYDLNGLTLGGLTLPADIDSDGDLSDLTAIYSKGAASSILLTGNVAGDIWVGGAITTLSVTSGSLSGNLTAEGNVGTISLGSSFGSSLDVQGSLKSFLLSGGNFAGDLSVGGALSKFSVTASKTGTGGAFCAGADVTVGGSLKAATITTCQTLNGGNDFGLYAGSFGKLTVGAWKLSASNIPFHQDDFCVEPV